MSVYVNRMKGVLTSFNTTAQRIQQEINYNNRTFDATAAGDANVQLQTKLNQAAEEARARITDIHEDAKGAVRKWAEPAGAEIDTADLKLLDGNFHLSADDLNSLLVKHQNNGTMVNSIAKYAKEHGLTPGYIPNVEDKLYVYNRFAESANSMIADIVHSIGIADNNIGLTQFGQRGSISQRAELVLYGIEKYEEPRPVPHAAFNFNFKPLDGR